MPGPDRRPVVPEDLLRIRFVTDPQLSPDGSRVAFVVTTLSAERDEYLSTIWVVDTAGGAPPRPFTAGPKRDTAPRWSPDRGWLAFVSERGRKKKAQLYVMPAGGGEPTRLTDLPGAVESPAWSPDGARLAFVSRVGGAEEPEREEDREKSKPARVIDVLKYKWNGVGFIHDRPRHVFVVRRDGGEPRQVTRGDFDDRDPAWAPDGRWLVFASARHPERDEDIAADLWVVAEGGEPLRLTSTPGPVAHPAVSADGRTIAYLGHPYRRDVSRNTRVYVVPFEGGTPRCLTETLDRHCEPPPGAEWPRWLGPASALLFVAEDRGAAPLYRVDVSGATPPGRVIGGERQVTGISASVDGGLIAFTATAATAPAEVFVCHPDGTEERQLTELNARWREEVVLAVPEPFRFERAGFTIDGWVMRPFGIEADRRYPALLNVHGGPATQYGHRFFDEFQVYAGAGYGVVYVNPRGSQGYGEAFAHAVVGDWGGGDCADVMAGLDEALRRHAWIDSGRLGVLGGSYGGYLTSWIVSHTDRFRAACSERAVNALWSMFGTSDIGHWFQEAHAGGRPPWEALDWYIERSPLTHAASIRTPLLIVHAESDLRCPVEQAEQLFVALRKLRRPVRFVRFADGDHDLSRTGRPRQRLERFRILLDWFGEHLPSGPA